MLFFQHWYKLNTHGSSRKFPAQMSNQHNSLADHTSFWALTCSRLTGVSTLKRLNLKMSFFAIPKCSTKPFKMPLRQSKRRRKTNTDKTRKLWKQLGFKGAAKFVTPSVPLTFVPPILVPHDICPIMAEVSTADKCDLCTAIRAKEHSFVTQPLCRVDLSATYIEITTFAPVQTLCDK